MSEENALPRDAFPVDLSACRARQQRLLEFMRRHDIDLAIVTQVPHVQYLTGVRFAWTFSPVVALDINGRLTLVGPSRPDSAAADEVLTYEAQWLSTLRNDQRAASSAVLLKALTGQPKARRLGVEFSITSPHFLDGLGGELMDIEPELYRLRRRKDADELALIKKAIAGSAAMHRRAREIIEPGVNELYVFNQLQAAAVEEFGEMLTGTGNDYACGERGGASRNRAARARELYILDLGPAFRGYFADNCRAYAVDGKPTDAQLKAREHIEHVFSIVERQVRPGSSCKELFSEAKAWLDEAGPWVFDHHLGHGIGLYPHEAPHLNPNWEDTFQAGEVIAVEPGLYGPDLRAGIRLENNYLVTETGVELLTPFSLSL